MRSNLLVDTSPLPPFTPRASLCPGGPSRSCRSSCTSRRARRAPSHATSKASRRTAPPVGAEAAAAAATPKAAAKHEAAAGETRDPTRAWLAWRRPRTVPCPR